MLKGLNSIEPAEGDARMRQRQLLAQVIMLFFAACSPSLALGAGIPGELAPLEYLVGGWKGTAVPQANRLKGWQEKHNWAWRFVKGTPVGIRATLENNKVMKE